MLKRLHVKNYRALVDLTLELEPKQLLLGRNGAGKTSIFDILAAVRDVLVEGEKCEDVLSLETVPRWLKGDKPSVVMQRVEIDAAHEDSVIRYALEVEHDEKFARSRIFSETLSSEG